MSFLSRLFSGRNTCKANVPNALDPLQQKLSLLRTEQRKSIYPIYDTPYLDLMIDEVFLDSLLGSRYPGNAIEGLVPTTSGWFQYEKDEELVWERILPEDGRVSVCPILICPDDQDYFCTTLVVEIEQRDSVILWNRFGINKKYEFGKYDLIGKEVDWIDDMGSFQFDLENYRTVVERLKSDREG